MGIRFTCGDKKEAISVMREAAQWLIEIGQPMWDQDDLSPEKLNNPPDEFWVMWDDDKSIASMILSFEDRFFCPISRLIHPVLFINYPFAGSMLPKATPK